MSAPPQGSKTSTPLREHLNQVYKATGKKPKELADQPPLPEFASYLWQWYCELHQGEALTFCEIESWSRLTRKNIASFEVDVLRKLNRIFWEHKNGRAFKSSNSS